MLGWRLGISAILVPLLILIFALDHRLGETAPVLLAVCLLLAARATWELVALLQTRSFKPRFQVVLPCTLAIVIAGWFDRTGNAGLANPMVAFSVVVLVLFLHAAMRFETPGQSMESLGAELLVVCYVGVLLTVTARLRWVAGADAGYLALSSLVIAAKCGDIGGYTLGRLFGRKKLVPQLSPGKTWMGGYGALLGAALGSWAWLRWGTGLFNDSWIPCAWYWSVLYGLIIGLVGLVGDLCESLIKRDVGQKDSAPLLPGFGGLLDLLDSILYAGPIAYVLWSVLPLLGRPG